MSFFSFHALLAGAVLSCCTADAASLTWSASQGRDWDSGATNFNGGAATFAAGDDVTFTNTGAGLVFIGSGGVASNVAPGMVTISTSSNYLFGGGVLAAGSLVKLGSGTTTFSNITSFAHADTTVRAGILYYFCPTGLVNVAFGTGTITIDGGRFHWGVNATANNETSRLANAIVFTEKGGWLRIGRGTAGNPKSVVTGPVFLNGGTNNFATFSGGGTGVAGHDLTGTMTVNGTNWIVRPSASGESGNTAYRLMGNIVDGTNAGKIFFLNNQDRSLVVGSANNTWSGGTVILSNTIADTLSGNYAGAVIVDPQATLGPGDVTVEAGAQLNLHGSLNLNPGAALNVQGTLFVTNGVTNRVSLLTLGGSTYTSGVFTTNNGGGYIAGNGAIAVGNSFPPSILVQPAAQTSSLGGSATFSVSAGGSPVLLYQWRFGVADIPGATNASLTLSGISCAEVGAYSVVVSNPFGFAVSTNVLLVVTQTPPIVATPPASTSVVEGGSATFSVVATNNCVSSRYQWRYEGTAIGGATNATFTLSPISLTDAGGYSVLLSNSAGVATSGVATLTVLPGTNPPAIVQHPLSVTGNVGVTVQFTAVAGGSSPLTRQWLRDEALVAGATNATLTLTNIQTNAAGAYRMVASNPYGSATSDVATLTVNRVPVAGPDALSTTMNLPVTVPVANLMTNDTDADGDTLTFVAALTPSVNGGTVSVVSAQATYTPPNGFAGSDSFRYVIADGRGGVATGTVSVAIPDPTQTHPRLFFTSNDVAGFRAKANLAPWSNMLAAIEWNLERDATGGYEQFRPFAQAMATLHLFRDSGVAPTDYAEQAKLAVLWNISALDASGVTVWGNPSYKALTRAGRTLGTAIAYDICNSVWTGQVVPATFVAGTGVTYNVPAVYVGMDLNAAVSLALKSNADSLVQSGGAEWPGDTKLGNNWFAVRYGSALLSYLSCDEGIATWSNNYNTCLSKIRQYLDNNLTKRTDANGWNPEGIAYAQYPGYFLYPATYALKRLRGVDLPVEYPAMTKALWATYQGVLPIDRYSRTTADGDTRIGWAKGLRPDMTDDHNAWDPEGTAGLAFAFAPESYKPGLKWMYRRLCGDLGDRTWDCSTGNGLWSLLFYPDALTEQNPAACWGNTYVDLSYGVFIFRNGYSNENDFVLQTHGNLRQNLGGHAGADGLGLRVYGLGVPWTVGSGRTSDPRGQTTLFNDDPNDVTSSATAVVPSLVDRFVRANGDGYTIMNMDTTEVGVGNQTRRIVTDFSGASGAPGLFVISDTSQDGLWWRLNTPSFNTITTNDSGFTIASPDGHRMTATVLWPTGVTFRTGTFARPPSLFYRDVNAAPGGGMPYSNINKWVDFAGNGDGSFLVAITVVPSNATPPVVVASGTGVVQTLTVGTRTITLNGNAINVNGWTRPAVAVTSPLDGQNYNTGATNIALAGTASDVDGLARVEVYLDGRYNGEAALVGTNWTYVLTSVAVGSHAVEARAIDVVADSGSATITVKVNSTVPPACTLDSPTFASVLYGDQNVTFYGRASDPEGSLNRVEVWADGAKLGNATITGGTWKYTWNAVKTGHHKVQAIAFDGAGDFTATPMLTIRPGVAFGPDAFGGDAANFFTGGTFAWPQPQLAGNGRWTVVEEDGDLRLRVRPVSGSDFDAFRSWLVGSETAGAANWRIDYLFKPGAPLTTNMESFLLFGRGTDAEMTLDLRPFNGVTAGHPNSEAGTRVWHRINSGPLVGVAWSFNAAAAPAQPTNDYAGIPTAGWNTVRVDRVGKNMKVRVNDRLILDATNGFLGTKGPVGFGNWRPFGTGGSMGFYDNVVFTPLDSAGFPNPDALPTATFAAPSPAAHANVAAGTLVEFAASVADGDGLAGVQFVLGAESLGAAVFTNGLWRTTWTAATGSYAVCVRVLDNLGRTNHAGLLPFRVAAAGANGSPTVSIARDPAVTNAFRFTGTATDADGAVAVVHLIRDGLAVLRMGVTGGTWSVIYSNAPAGTHAYAVRAADDLGAETLSTNLLLSLDPPSTNTPPFSRWLLRHDLTGAVATASADADEDGHANLLEYVTGGNPTNADSIARMESTRTGGVFALVFTRDTNAVDATLVVEGAYTFTQDVSWLGIAVNSNGTWSGAPVAESGVNPVSVTVPDTAPAASSRFLRLRVTSP